MPKVQFLTQLPLWTKVGAGILRSQEMHARNWAVFHSFTGSQGAYYKSSQEPQSTTSLSLYILKGAITQCNLATNISYWPWNSNYTISQVSCLLCIHLPCARFCDVTTDQPIESGKAQQAMWWEEQEKIRKEGQRIRGDSKGCYTFAFYSLPLWNTMPAIPLCQPVWRGM